MSGDIYNQTDEQRTMTAALNAEANEWDSIASAAEQVTETPASERSAWQSEYAPTGAHAAKMQELSTGTAGLATQARAIASRLRQAATGVMHNAAVVDENNTEAEANLNSVDTDLEGGFTI